MKSGQCHYAPNLFERQPALFPEGDCRTLCSRCFGRSVEVMTTMNGSDCAVRITQGAWWWTDDGIEFSLRECEAGLFYPRCSSCLGAVQSLRNTLDTIILCATPMRSPPHTPSFALPAAALPVRADGAEILSTNRPTPVFCFLLAAGGWHHSLATPHYSYSLRSTKANDNDNIIKY